jgi:uncharacterized protein
VSPPGRPKGEFPLAGTARSAGGAPASALDDAELDALQRLLDGLPADREPLDVVMLDGFLCGVLLQPRRVPEAQWLARVVDVDGRPPPAGFALEGIAALVRRRHAELDRAIARRQWFDPWVYSLDDDASPSETVMPWVAGFALAVDAFPALMRAHEAELTEPLATLYRHLDPDDLEDADALLEEIETLEPPEHLAEAVEDLVRSVLLIADVSRPAERPAPRASAPKPHGAGRPPRRPPRGAR